MTGLRWAALAGAVCLALTPTVAASSVSQTAHRAAAEASAAVLIESVTPAAPKRPDRLEIAGRVANLSGATMTQPQVQLRLSPFPLNSREEVSQVLNTTTARTGTPVEGALQQVGDDLEPGQQAEYRLAVDLADLDLPVTAGVYAVFVDFVADGFSVTRAGTVFPWFPNKAEFVASQLSLLWPMVQQPAIAARELVIDPALPAELAPGGRLNRLLTAGRNHEVTWLVDASTLQSTTAMADGYQTVGADGPEPGDETQAAATFSEQLAAILAGGDFAVLPQFAVNDDDALQRGSLTPTVVRSATLPAVIQEATDKSARAPVAFVAPGGNSDDRTLRTLVDAGLRTVVLSDAAAPPSPATSYTASGHTTLDVGGTRVAALLADTRLDRYLDGPFDTAAERSAALQGVLCDTAMVTLERPAEPRAIVGLPPLRWDAPRAWLDALLAQLTKARWIDLVGTDQVSRTVEVPREKRAYSEAWRVRELPQSYVQRIEDLQGELESLSRIVNNPDGFGETFTLALQRAASALWRGERRGRNELMEAIDRQLQDERAKVRVVSSGTVTLAGDNGILPLTIANDLDRSITVGLQLRADNAIRLEYTPPEPVKVEAQAKAGVEVPVRVVGSQPMTVNVVLTDRNGLEFDDSATLELRSTAATRIAAVVAVVGGVTLAVLVVLNLWRRAHHRGDSA